jgi:hypothetical protein
MFRRRRWNQADTTVLGYYHGWSCPRTLEEFLDAPTSQYDRRSALERAFARLVEEGALVPVEDGWVLSEEVNERIERDGYR